jgi:hypothetical protein
LDAPKRGASDSPARHHRAKEVVMIRSTMIAFDRAWLACVMLKVRDRGIKHPNKGRGKAWVWTSDRRTWEFHYKPCDGCEFFTAIAASNAYEAKAKGWEEYLAILDRKEAAA